MNGNIHVQFLGEGVAVTPPPYPARMEKVLKPVDRHCCCIRAYELRHNPRTSPAAYPTRKLL
jgi:hypothetical protein